MRAHKLLSKAVVSLCALAATFAVSCVPAGAEISHKFLSSITEVPAEGPKGEAIALPGPLSETNAMTIDGGDLYVEEMVSYAEKSLVASPSRIDVFNAATHAFIRQFDQPDEAASVGIAVGHATGSPQIYVGAGERIKGEPYSVVVPFDAEGHHLGHPWLGEDTPAGAFSGHLVNGELEGNITDVAVDNNSTSLLGDWAAGDVFVATTSRGAGRFPALNLVDILKPEAGGAEKYQGQLTGTCESPGACPGKVVPFNSPSRIAVDPRNGDLLVVDSSEAGAHSVVDIFRPGPILGEYEFVGSLSGIPQGPFGPTVNIAIDSGEGSFGEGAIYVALGGNVYQFNSADQYVGRIEGQSGELASVAVDPTTHDVYTGGRGQVEIFGPSLLLPDVTTAPVSSPAPESATLNGTVNPDKAGAGETTCQFVWGTSESFGHVLPCPTPVAEGESPTPVSALLEGLEPDTTYYFRLQASNANGTNVGEASQTLHFTTPGPGITEEFAHTISSTSATLAVSIDPHGAGTTYYFQYGTTSTYGSEAPASPGVSIGAGQGDNEEMQHLQGLSPNTTYHYRAVAISDLEVEPGVFKEISFEGHDQTFTTQTAGGTLTLPDGRAWELVSPVNKHGSIILPHETKASEFGDAVTYSDFGPPIGENAAGYDEGGSQVFSERGPDGWSSQDMSLPRRQAAGIALGRDVGQYGDFSEDLSLGIVEEIGTFTSLVPDATPPDTERTPYIRHDDTCSAQPSSCYLPLLTGAPGYADVPPGTVFDVASGNGIDETIKFVAATPDFSHVLINSAVALTHEGEPGTYEWSSEKPPAERLQLITGGEVVGLRPGKSNLEKTAESGGHLGLSEDGSRVVIASGGHLYQRDMTDGRTAQLDEVQSGASGAGGPSTHFQIESTDGSVVYFTDSQSLTKDSVEGDDDLYECRMRETAGEYKCDLTDIAHTVSGVTVLGASKDAAYVYFVSSDVLSNQAGSDGEKAVAGAPDNLYELHDGAISLIAVPNQGAPSRVSPDGNYLAFGSEKSLTGYDNAGAEELFLFDSATDRVACASCNPSGTRPEGSSKFPPEPLGSFPGPGKSRYLSTNGQLFFESSEALAPQDINKNVDVYEYEPVGGGNCSPSSLSYKASSDGCIGLISSGTAAGESTFLDASEDGDDVFFLTTEKLAADDVDTAADIYDAHLCSNAVPCAIAPSPPPPPCVTADACRAAPSPQPAVFGSPASATFAGAGNVTSKPAAPPAKPKSLTRAQKLARALKICRREAKRKRATCERKARKQYSSKPAHRARVTKGGRG